MTKSVFIVGYYGAGNAGDEAILESMLGEFRAHIPNLRPVVVSADPPSTSRAYNVPSISNSDRSAVVAATRDCDFILLGGGGLLNDYWDVSLASLFSQDGATLNYYSYAALAALYAKPLILYALGVGPLSSMKGRLYTRMVCEQAQIVTVRDEQSKALLGELGIDAARVHVTADPAFLLTHPLPALDLPRPILGVALRHWSIDIDPKAWESKVATALDEFLRRHGGSVLFLPFQKSTTEGDDDAVVADRVRSRMRRRASATVFEAAGAAGELAGAIGRCDLVLGMRYHSVLFALRHGVPTVGLVYEPKVRNLLAQADCEDYALDLSKVRSDNLLDRLECAFADRSLPGRLKSASDRMSTAASEDSCRVTALVAGDASDPPTQTTRRWWLDELSAEAAFNEDGGVKRAIAERRNCIRLEHGQDWPYDVICFPGIEWDFRWMRAQRLMSQFAEREHRVFFVSVTKFLPRDGPKFTTRALRRNVWEVQLATPEPVDVYSGSMPDEVRNALVDDLAALAGEFAIDRAACILHLPSWSPAAYQLRSLFGWLVVYDCMDDWSGFAWMPQALVDRELLLAGDSDLVVVSAQRLWDKWSSRNGNTLLVRNGADPQHFGRISDDDPPVAIPSSCPVVGFFGAIDSWFDVELVRRAAAARPQYFFALIGPVYDDRAEELGRLPNVQLFGHQPYDLLPAFLRRFDACIIPFRINAVTQSTDPVKFYEYIAQGKPVVSTRLPELEPYRDVAYLAETPEDFIRLLDVAVAERDPGLLERRLAVARENSWTTRYELFDAAIKRTFDAGQTPQRILFAYQTLSLGGVEIVLESRVAELRRRGCRICLVFMEEIDGRVLFEGSGVDIRICQAEAELADVLAGFTPDWIVSIDLPVVLPIARRTAPGAGLIYEVHSSYPHMLAPLADRDFLTGVRGVIVPSASQGQRIQPLMAVDKPVEVVPNALSPAFIEKDDRFEAPLRPIILWVGRLDSLKGWRAFVEIASRLRDRTDAEFLMVSAGFSGEDGAELPKLIESLGIGNRFRGMRAVEHSRMPAIYHDTARSGGCLVSTSANESFGMAVLEAMACGCPVVVPNVVGLRDLVRHSETGRVYPSGELAAACEEVIKTLSQPPELRRTVTEKAAEFATRFTAERTADRFLSILADWSTPGDAQTEPKSALAPSREFLARILATVPEDTTVAILPPSMPWTAAALSNRAQQWARAFARRGCLVFYCDPQGLASDENRFTEVESRIFVANAPLEAYAAIEAPVVVASASNLEQLRHFSNPLVLYECREDTSENESALMDVCAEWLARATVVTVSSEQLRDSIGRQRPDAMLVSDAHLLQNDFVLTILDKLKSPGTGENDPVRLKPLLAWRERQVHTLQRQIRDRNRPAVEILQEALAEQRRILAERVKGIAFLRSEAATREQIVAEQKRAVEFLKNEVSHREGLIAFLRNEIESRDGMIRDRQSAIEFLQQETAARNGIVSEQQSAIEFLEQEAIARTARITFLCEELAQRERIISERQDAIEFLQREFAARDVAAAAQIEGIAFLQHEVNARDAAAAAQLAGIAFLRNEVTQREQIIEERDRQLLEAEAAIARLHETVREIETKRSWLVRWLLGRSRREGT